MHTSFRLSSIAALAVTALACNSNTIGDPDTAGSGSTSTTDASTGVGSGTTGSDSTSDDPSTSGVDSTTAVDTADASTTASDTSTSDCGNGTIETGEMCDDGNADDGDGCSAACSIDEGWYCDGTVPSVCTTICGDLVVGAPAESCDDGNTIANDACTNTCQAATCGDGIVWEGMENCDDGMPASGDGCSDTCLIEPGFVCTEALGCFRGIVLADGASATAGNLYAVSTDGTISVTIGPLGVALTGLAFHPDGTLYGVTATNGAGAAQLGTIDLATANFTVVGSLISAGGTPHSRMPDITFIGDQLVGWTESGDDLVMIDTATAQVIPIPTDRSSYGTGLAYDSAADALYVAPSGAGGTLYEVDIAGMVSAGPTLGGMRAVVKGMSYYDGLLYGMDIANGGPGAGEVVTYDPTTGARVLLSVVPSFAVDALAIYDPGNVPAP